MGNRTLLEALRNQGRELYNGVAVGVLLTGIALLLVIILCEWIRASTRSNRVRVFMRLWLTGFAADNTETESRFSSRRNSAVSAGTENSKRTLIDRPPSYSEIEKLRPSAEGEIKTANNNVYSKENKEKQMFLDEDPPDYSAA